MRSKILDDLFIKMQSDKKIFFLTADMGINLLEKFGGFWIDATVYCIKPLTEWINNYIDIGFFLFYRIIKEKNVYGENDTCYYHNYNPIINDRPLLSFV